MWHCRDCEPVDRANPIGSPRQSRGQVAHHSGLAAEETVERELAAAGLVCLARRWRGPGGEIDLIFRDGDRIIFVEVKTARSHAEAAERISRRQADRIAASAQSFLASQPNGLMTDMRLDVALVDGTGRVELLKNAFAGWW
ncbi:YraN family protein [Pseudooceanicola atlanticus]|uniref:YraN family protein n=1 Tax=Pseudooceanicola atlanticus TaxID=1461694 RepID=UPI0009E0B29B|nr:YraN family protein [Pseudooceanicola atlanticus]